MPLRKISGQTQSASAGRASDVAPAADELRYSRRLGAMDRKDSFLTLRPSFGEQGRDLCLS